MAIPILVGEIAYNVRSALDSLVYDLAVLGKKAATASSRKKWKDPIGTQFPIEDNPQVFDARVTGTLNGKSVAKYLDWVPKGAVDAIRALQPFAGCEWTAILREISNQDKHRFLSELRIKLEGEIPVPEIGEEQVGVDGLALGLYLHPRLVPLFETVQLIQREAEAFVALFEVELG